MVGHPIKKKISPVDCKFQERFGFGLPFKCLKAEGYNSRNVERLTGVRK